MAIDSGSKGVSLKNHTQTKIITRPLANVVILDNKYIINALPLGILAMIQVPTFSTSTADVGGVVSAGHINVHKGLPNDIGANIGTPVTNTMGAKGQSGNRTMLQRAFARAMVHDQLELLAVFYLLRLEMIIGAIQGQRGPLYWTTQGLPMWRWTVAHRASP